MKCILLCVFIWLYVPNNLYGQINLVNLKKNTFKIIVYLDGYPIKTGSGFVYKSSKKNGRNISIGISNAHVLDRGDSIVVQFEDNTASLKYFDFIDVEKDLISFQFETTDFKQGFASTTQVNFNQGDEVFTMSNPKGLEYSLSKGEISSIRTEYNNQMIQFTAPASPGSSGSPLLNNKGQLIGIVSSQIYGGQNLNFALSTNSAKDFFNKYSQPELTPTQKLIKRIFNYKSESSPIIKQLQETIVKNKSNADVYSALQANKRYVLLDNYCLMHKIRIETEEKLYQNALESLASYNNNFGLNSQLICLQYSSIISDLPEANKKLLLEYIEFNGSLINQYNTEPFFLYNQAILNFKLKDYYSAISNAIKFTALKEDFNNPNSTSGIKYINSLNKILVASAYKIMADCYKELENFKLTEDSYLNAINNSLLIGDWCKNSRSLIIYYYEQKQYKKLCGFVKILENNTNYPKCDLNKLVGDIKELCEIVQ